MGLSRFTIRAIRQWRSVGQISNLPPLRCNKKAFTIRAIREMAMQLRLVGQISNLPLLRCDETADFKSALRIALGFLFILLASFQTRHAFHTSVTRMEYNAQAQAFEVSIRVFTDDLETTLTKDNNGRKFLVVNGDANDPFIEKYVRKNFALFNAQKQKKPYSYVGKEQEVDATWIYLEIPCREPIAGFSVQQAVLFDAFDDQVNLLNLKYLAQKKSYIFKSEQKIQDLGM